MGGAQICEGGSKSASGYGPGGSKSGGGESKYAVTPAPILTLTKRKTRLNNIFIVNDIYYMTSSVSGQDEPNRTL